MQMIQSKLFRMTSANLEKASHRLMTKIIMFIKPKRREQYVRCFLQYQVVKAQKRINDDE